MSYKWQILRGAVEQEIQFPDLETYKAYLESLVRRGEPFEIVREARSGWKVIATMRKRYNQNEFYRAERASDLGALSSCVTVHDLVQFLPDDFQLSLGWFVDYIEDGKLADGIFDTEYSYSGKVGDFETAMEGYDWQFEMSVDSKGDFELVEIDFAKKECYLKHVETVER